MPVVSIQLDNLETANKFIKDTNKRLKSKNMLRNPFQGGFVKGFYNKKEYNAVVCLNPLYPNPLPIAIMVMAFIVVIKGFVFSKLHIITAILFIAYFFHTGYFYYCMFYYGLRKHGYMGKIKKINNNTMLMKVAQWVK